jgi:predicted  nucleic acid-binding Zn-ribbon protein
MAKDAFAQLEERIGQAVSRIRVLSEERTRLSARQEELEEQLTELVGRNRRLEGEIGELREAHGEEQDFDATRQEIERRVEGLLERFAELDEIAGE